jgi:hypothetical protein
MVIRGDRVRRWRTNYRDRPNPTYYWKSCVREGRIVSGLGGVRRSDLP